MTWTRRQFVSGLAACPACVAAVRGARADGAHWNYEHPQSWGEDSAFKVCGIGDQQSPIDLRGAVRADIEAPTPAWRSGVFEVANNGHTLQIDVPPGAFVTSQGRRYELTQFHFHTPSEHAIDGKRSAMEAHFVHMREGGGAAVVGVFFEGGPKDSSPVFSAVMAVAPKTEGKAKLGAAIDPSALLPRSKRFYRYEGSLTTPPCAEVVEWSLFVRPVTVAQSDIAAFRAVFPMNARPIQPINRRFLLTN